MQIEIPQEANGHRQQFPCPYRQDIDTSPLVQCIFAFASSLSKKTEEFQSIAKVFLQP
jgi:hypothetical protein